VRGRSGLEFDAMEYKSKAKQGTMKKKVWQNKGKHLRIPFHSLVVILRRI